MSVRRICISGYFDPLHVGHLEYMKLAKEKGDELIVIVNNDYQAKLKKGKSFMNENERLEIVKSIKYVDHAILAIDSDRTVCNTLRKMSPKPDAFCNGGDQNNKTIPEISVCIERGIDLIDGLGDKIQSSSWLTGLNAKK